jgi:creatinine amidohydrolase/Fe(II)-dependent formamide hydrolase-like protein
MPYWSDLTLEEICAVAETGAVAQVTVGGVAGRPTTASPASGERLFGTVADGLVELLVAARAEDDPL